MNIDNDLGTSFEIFRKDDIMSDPYPQSIKLKLKRLVSHSLAGLTSILIIYHSLSARNPVDNITTADY